MSVTLTGAEGFFTRRGVEIGAYNYVASLYGSPLTSDFQAIWSQYASTDQPAVVGLPGALEAFRQSGANYAQNIQAVGNTGAPLQVDRDFSLVPYTVTEAFTRIRTQMLATAQSINRPTLTTTVAAGSGNDGDTSFIASTTNIYGDPLDMTLTETFTVTCTSQGSGFSASFNIVGEAAVPENSWNWPQGSGVQTSVSVTDAAVDGIITGGDFETYTVANTPDNWVIEDGSAGVTVFESAGTGVRTNTNNVYIQSDGAQNTQLSQSVSLTINTVYAYTFYAKMNSNSASGTCVFRICNGDTGVTLNDDAGNALVRTLNLNGGAGEVTTSWQQFSGFFSTPRQLPSNVEVRIGYGVFGVSTRRLNLDLAQLVQATPLYGASGTGTSGPFVAAFAKTLPSAVNDTYTIDFTNSLTTQSFALGLERVYGLRELGVYMPSAVSETIPDSLVTH